MKKLNYDDMYLGMKLFVNIEEFLNDYLKYDVDVVNHEMMKESFEDLKKFQEENGHLYAFRDHYNEWYVTTSNGRKDIGSALYIPYDTLGDTSIKSFNCLYEIEGSGEDQ